MYLDHFDLDEGPFAITPDPRFVFLSERHREALAHLLYGLGEGGGFVQLTGEVGTGKTTICRTLLRQLPDHVDAALIFNPRLTVPELLDSLCVELGIERADQTSSIKARIDWLYAYLLDANARGRRTVLIIDEAQSLSLELLETVRLLTNLETDHAKLLQVFLIGQPELRAKLAREDLRQLAQRVTARYHLEPLSLDEARHYIRHRLSVSGSSREIFSSAALRVVHRLTGGIPRRINILCDRALLGAYTTESHRVSAAVVRRAAAEVRGEHGSGLPRLARYAAVGLAAAGVVTVGALALESSGRLAGWASRAVTLDGAPAGSVSEPLATLPARLDGAPAGAVESSVVTARVQPEPGPDVKVAPGDAHVAAAVSAVAAAEVASSPAAPVKPGRSRLSSPLEPEPPGRTGRAPPDSIDPSAPDLVALMATLEDDGWRAALRALAGRWRVPSPAAGANPCVWARGQGLACHSRRASWAVLRDLDLPAVLRLHGPGGAEVYALLATQSGQDATVSLARRELQVRRDELEKLWQGEFFLLWRPPLKNVHQIRLGHTGPRVRWLDDALAAIAGSGPASHGSANFDARLQQRVKAFQRQHGLNVDGIVGPETFIHVTKQIDAGDLPSLQAATGPSADSRPVQTVAEVSR